MEDVLGTWHNARQSLYLSFYEDGTFHHALGLDSESVAVDEFWFEGTQVFLKTISVSGEPHCGDTVGIYEIRLNPDGTIRIVKIKDNCSPRVKATALALDPVP